MKLLTVNVETYRRRHREGADVVRRDALEDDSVVVTPSDHGQSARRGHFNAGDDRRVARRVQRTPIDQVFAAVPAESTLEHRRRARQYDHITDRQRLTDQVTADRRRRGRS